MLSDYTRRNIGSSISKLGGGQSGDFGGYGALSLGRAINNNWDWRVSGAYGRFMDNTRRDPSVPYPPLGTTETSSLQFGRADLDAGWTWRGTDLDLRLFGGVRGGYLNYKNDIDTQCATSPPLQCQVDLHSAFFGFGPHLGAEATWRLDSAGIFGIVGGFSGGALFGQRNADVTLAKVGLPFANIPRSKFDTVGELAGSLALAFSPNPSTTIKAGYRAEYTLNAFSKDEGFDQRNMLNHMPFARLEVRF